MFTLRKVPVLVFSITLLITACQPSSQQEESSVGTNDTTAVSEDAIASSYAEKVEERIYEGNLNCEDCARRQVELTLKKTEPVYQMETIYVGKSDSVYAQEGEYEIKKQMEAGRKAEIVILNPYDEKDERAAFIRTSDTDTLLYELDKDMNKLDSALTRIF